jgi:hypothetical protein
MTDTPDDDLFAAIEKALRPLPAGEHVGELMFVEPFSTPRTEGAEATIKITEGVYRGRVFKLRLVEKGPASIDGIIVREADALRSWWEAVEVEGRPSRADGFVGALKKIIKAGKGKRSIFKIGAQMGRANIASMYLIGVRVDDDIV